MRTKTKKYIILAVVLIAIIGITIYATRNKKTTSSSLGAVQAENLPGAKKTASINREFIFPIKNEAGEEVSQLRYVIESAELRDEIIVKGQKATSIEGRTFLVVSVKLTNSMERAISINTRDYVRLIRNGNPAEQLAPDIHNDPVSVQPISIKYARIGFPINETDTDLQLQVGEIQGQKEIVPITF